MSFPGFRLAVIVVAVVVVLAMAIYTMQRITLGQINKAQLLNRIFESTGTPAVAVTARTKDNEQRTTNNRWQKVQEHNFLMQSDDKSQTECKYIDLWPQNTLRERERERGLWDPEYTVSRRRTPPGIQRNICAIHVLSIYTNIYPKPKPKPEPEPNPKRSADPQLPQPQFCVVKIKAVNALEIYRPAN